MIIRTVRIMFLKRLVGDKVHSILGKEKGATAQ